MTIYHNQYVPGLIENAVFCYDEENPKGGIDNDIIRKKSNIGDSTIAQFANETQIFGTTAASVATYNSQAIGGTGFSGIFIFRRTGNTTGTWNPICLIDNGGPRYRQMWLGWYYNETFRIHNSLPYYASSANNTNWWSTDPFWTDNGGSAGVINQWYMYSFSYNNATRECRTFLNGRFLRNGIRPGLGDINNPNNANIRLYGINGNSYNNSQIKFATMFNRAITDTEMSFWYNSYISKRFSI